MGTFRFDWLEADLVQLLQLTFGSIVELPIVANTPTRFVLGSGTDDFTLTGVGTGFAYIQFNGQIADVTAGTISSFTAKGHGDFGGFGFSFTDLDLSMAILANHVFAENWTAVNQYLFSGADMVVGATNLNVISTFAGNDTVYGGLGYDTLNGGSGDDKLYGSSRQDDLYGGSNNDSLFGGQGDQFFPSEVNHMFGGTGNDDLTGGSGIDRLTGGAGRDAFIFKTALRSAQHDTITDFRAVDDVIRLDNAAFKAFTTLGTMLATRFHIGVAAADGGDRIIYDRAEGVLSYDRDGTGSAAAVIFAVVDPGTALGYQDFVII